MNNEDGGSDLLGQSAFLRRSPPLTRLRLLACVAVEPEKPGSGDRRQQHLLLQVRREDGFVACINPIARSRFQNFCRSTDAIAREVDVEIQAL
jgi:hypothetical protein